MNKASRYWLVLMPGLLLAGCGGSSDSFLGDFELPTFGSDEDLERQLELPPDLDAPLPTEDYNVSDTKVAAAMTSSVLPQRLNMRLYREGDVVWLAVAADPVSLWPNLRSFFEGYGFAIVEANPAHGYLQTDWRERTVQVASGASIRTRDQFRLHIERAPNALTSVYIANRSSSYFQNEWRLNNPDRNAEWLMLQSLRDYLASLIDAKNVRRQTLERATAALDVVNMNGVPVMSVGQAYSRVWRRLSVALSRAGWDIASRDRSRGIYHVRYPSQPLEESAVALPPRLRSQTLQLRLLEAGDKTFITAHLARDNSALSYEEAYEVLRSAVNAYGVGDE